MRRGPACAGSQNPRFRPRCAKKERSTLDARAQTVRTRFDYLATCSGRRRRAGVRTRRSTWAQARCCCEGDEDGADDTYAREDCT